MNDDFLLSYPRPYVTDMELFALMGGTPDSFSSKIKRLIAQGKLLHIRRGLYVISGLDKPHPYALAQFIYGPSYISLESALSFHGLIPEAVKTVTSVSTKRSKVFSTPLGIFSYESLPRMNFLTEVALVESQGARFYMAKPWKAICDYVYIYKKDWTTTDPLFESLRINENVLPVARFEEIQLLDEFYHQKRVSRFLKGALK